MSRHAANFNVSTCPRRPNVILPFFFESPPPAAVPRDFFWPIRRRPPLPPPLCRPGLTFTSSSPGNFANSIVSRLHHALPALPPLARLSHRRPRHRRARLLPASGILNGGREEEMGGEGAFLSWHSHGERERKETWRIFRDLCQSDVPLLRRGRKS